MIFTFLNYLKFIYTEKAKKFCEIFPLLLTVCTVVKSKGKISQNFVAFLEYMNFKQKYKNVRIPCGIIESKSPALYSNWYELLKIITYYIFRK